MAQLFKVRQGCSIFTSPKKGISKLIIGGQTVSADQLNPKNIAEHVEQGWIIPVRDDTAPEAAQIVEDIPGRDVPKAAIGGSLEKGTVVTGTRSSEAGTRPVEINTSGVVKQVETKWNLDPSTLMDKPLEELNVMIAERDPKQAPCDTVEEAIAFLSQGFEG